MPCSGDGTIRKAPDIWAKWTPGGANSLHPLQLQIAMHACRMLKVGGLMVYSTCSFNPVENEAVVAEILRRAAGSVELLDVSQTLPNLKRMLGLKKWFIQDKGGSYASWEQARAANAYKVDKSMFYDDATEAMPLERCMRFLPHHQVSGKIAFIYNS